MKKSWQAVMIASALSIIIGSVSGALAQREPIAGGYAETSTGDPEAVAAARFATGAEGRKAGARIALLSIERAERQVVAGTNYRLRLKVKVNGRTQEVTAVVYKNLKREYSLSGWEADSKRAGGGAISSGSTIEQLVKSLAEAYTAKSLGSLDAERPYDVRVRIIIEHSLAEDDAKERFERRQFKTLEQAERWLRSREREDQTPSRQIKPLLRCARGLCTYDFDGGILHNQLYLRKISYGYRNGRPLIKTIFLLDGD